MDSREVDEYREQLSTVNELLKSDSDNAELLELKNQLETLIQLSQGDLQKSELKNEPSTKDEPRYKQAEINSQPKVGEIVLAKWLSGDRKMYAAKVNSVTGSHASPIYIVKFLKYENTETLTLNHIRSLDPAQQKEYLAELETLKITNLPKRPATESKFAAADFPPPSKKAIPIVASKIRLNESQQSWKKFANKGVKMSSVGGRKKIGQNSIFKSPEGITGRVGYSGSGRPMTQHLEREKHKFHAREDDE